MGSPARGESPPVAVGVDVGGTKIAAAVVARDGTVIDRRRVATPVGDRDRLVATIATVVEDIGPSLPVGLGVAGIISPTGVLRYSPNLDLHDVPVGPALTEALGRPAVVKNDATAALWGEHRVGAGQGVADLLMLTVGTGVGGAILANGQLVEGADGFGGELGHVIIVEGGRRCSCGNLGCLEAYASGSAIGRFAVERLRDGPSGSTSLADVDLVDGRAVTNAAVAGDEVAQQIIAGVGHWLGIGLVNFVNILDPARILIGGGAASNAAPWLLPPAEHLLAAHVLGAAHRGIPEVRLAALGADAGMIGAALLAAEQAS